MLAEYILEEFDVLVPDELVPCQYHVVPSGGFTRVNVLLPQKFVDTVGAVGLEGIWFTVTPTLAEDELQHPVVLLRARR